MVDNNCHFQKHLPHDNQTHCMAYSKAKRNDGKYWAYFPKCESQTCPYLHPELITKEAKLKL